MSLRFETWSWITCLLLLAGTLNGPDLPACFARQDAAGQAPGLQLRDLDSYFPLEVPADLDAWQRRKTELKKHLRVSLGLWPFPNRNPLNAVIHGPIDQGEYTVEKVYFESLPGFLVTGNLYRPKNINGKIPGIISPHGHFPEGRFGAQGEDAISQTIENGAESFRSNAKNNIQTRCANLAKMGCVVFDYDMIGYADSQQISYDVAHRFAKQTAEMNGSDRWGLFSPYAELNLQNVMGLQAWNSIRALDFLESLPEVDSTRIGVTGASGGGTQTFIVCALDDRPAAAFPAVMVSTAMQGGCTCENCCYLRVGTGNVELAAMFAPKPLGLTAANDWTREIATKGFPELQSIYDLYGKRDLVQLTARTEFGHNYNQVSREAMYRWFKKHLRFDGDPVETEIEFLGPEEITVFDKSHPRPPGGTRFEQNLLAGLASPSTRANDARIELAIMEALNDPAFAARARQKYQSEDRVVLFRKIHTGWESFPKELRTEILSHLKSGSGTQTQVQTFVDVVMNTARFTNGEAKLGSAVPVETDLEGTKSRQWKVGTSRNLPESTLQEFSIGAATNVLLISRAGISGAEDAPPELVSRLLQSTNVVVFQNGWMEESDWQQTRRVKNPREALAYTVGYNAPQLARRAETWLAGATLLANREQSSNSRFYVVSVDGTAPEAVLNAAGLKSWDKVAGIVIKTNGFRFQQITDIRDPNLLPGAMKYGDLPGMLSLSAPIPMLLIGENEESVPSVTSAYQRAGASENLTLIKTIPTGRTEADVVADWIETRESENNQRP